MNGANVLRKSGGPLTGGEGGGERTGRVRTRRVPRPTRLMFDHTNRIVSDCMSIKAGVLSASSAMIRVSVKIR